MNALDEVASGRVARSTSTARPSVSSVASAAIFSSSARWCSSRLDRFVAGGAAAVLVVGAVLPVGGIKEKVLAAHRAGIKRIILPERCRKDLIDVPDQAKNEMEFIFVTQMDDLAAIDPYGPQPDVFGDFIGPLLLIELGLLQPAMYGADTLGARTLFPQDLRGTAWFDDVVVSQVPKVRMSTDRPGNIFRRGETLGLEVVVNDRSTDGNRRMRLDPDGVKTEVAALPIQPDGHAGYRPASRSPRWTG